MTNVWMDIKNSDVIVIMGGNAAEAHPCGFKWVTEAKAHNKAKLVVVDPRFTRSASVADFYCPIRPGSDIAFLGGVINYLLTNDKIQKEYVLNYTNASYIVKPEYGFRRTACSPASTRKSATTTSRAGNMTLARTVSPRSTRRFRIRAASISS